MILGQNKTVITEIVITVIRIIFKNPWLFQKHLSNGTQNRNRRMRNRTYGGVRGRKTKVGEKLLRFPPTRLLLSYDKLDFDKLPFLYRSSSMHLSVPVE